MIDICSVLPHRPPFLFIDGVTDVEPGRWARGYKNVSRNEWFFRGHFPDHPVMPGVIIVEAMSQMGAFAVMEDVDRAGGSSPRMISIQAAHFNRAVMPGDRLELYFEVMSHRGPYLKGRSEASVDGKPVARLEDLFVYLKPRLTAMDTSNHGSSGNSL